MPTAAQALCECSSLCGAGALPPLLPTVHELVLHAGSGRVLGRLAIASRQQREFPRADRDLLLRLGGAPSVNVAKTTASTKMYHVFDRHVMLGQTRLVSESAVSKRMFVSTSAVS